jgi:hypothetical protein
MDDKGVLLIEIISTLFVAKLVEEKMLNRTEIKDSFEILVDYQNELYGADYEIILDEKDCPLNLHSYLDSITITARLINKLIQLTQKEEDRYFLRQIKRNFADEVRFIKNGLENNLDKGL